MIRSLVLASCYLFFTACSDEKNQNFGSDGATSVSSAESIKSENTDAGLTVPKTPKTFDSLIDVRELNTSILVDLKYTTDDNFMHMRLYDKIDRAYLQKDVAVRLAKVQDALSKKKPGFHLLIYDALRPVSVQRKMWEALDSLPPSRRGKFVSNPDKRSLHNMGAAVDITIIDDKGIPLDMGAGFDDIREIAYPSLEQQFLKSGELSAKQLENRLLLRRLMQAQGFRQLETEWWHYNACSRIEALKKYKVLLNEF
jgi:D-alanyl-D-alanine dipeptidase